MKGRIAMLTGSTAPFPWRHVGPNSTKELVINKYSFLYYPYKEVDKESVAEFTMVHRYNYPLALSINVFAHEGFILVFYQRVH